MRAPMMLIHTVAAGGGSILHLRWRALPRRPRQRGRQSRTEMLPPRRAAGRHRRQCDGRQADPGFLPEDFRTRAEPAARCRRGENRPSRRLAKEVGGKSPEEIADGFIKIAVENMANAIKKISVQRGYDVTRYALNCFGGAGGQHACLVADALGMTKVLDPSVLVAAVGLWHGARRYPRHARTGHRGEFPYGAKALAALNRDRQAARQGRQGRSYAGQGVPTAEDQGPCPRPYPLRRHRYGAGGGRRRSPEDEVRLRESAQGPLRLHRPHQATGDRSCLGRSRRRRREVLGEGGAASPAARIALARQAHAVLLRWRAMAQGQCLYTRPAEVSARR